MRLTDGIGRRLVLGNQYATELFDKLHALEDIEDELGIDLITLLKAIKNGIYHNQYGEEISFKPWHFDVDFNKKRFYCHIQDMCASWDIYCDFKDYGKTWALTKEELL